MIIETAQVFFPDGTTSYYKLGMGIQIPTKEKNDDGSSVYTDTGLIVEKIYESKFFRTLSVIFSNGESVSYTGIPYAISIGGFSDKQREALDRFEKRVAK